jgi:DHA2 family multidrug resistance protein
MFMVGVILLGSTVLIPHDLHLVRGDSATQAGLAISPGGLLVMCMLPFVGFLLGKVEARWMIGVGLAITSVALIHMSTFNDYISYSYAALARCYQAAGLAFLFVPINTAAYAFVPPHKNNAASGLINLARNIGGSVGISLVTTILDRRAQFHQNRLSEYTTTLNPRFNQAINSAQQVFTQHGYGPHSNGSYAMVMKSLLRQAQTLSYIDCFWLLGVTFACMIPLVFIMRKQKPGRGAMAH